ncbi:hypothetical protein DICPUDRAFT_56890 [Dictyostelium purpureum]|uniref:Uncharacterized protein n=1 Tax=Dictyostelium purpureum TaxID=5786 RepID=F0ZTH8_DICPU|nr:uncharacterized protein DICPUDRAFT_56890 [Dictyostelium purpureum]EGC32753.1 hypothetical protein DICPUDRAFT_56890 [Dictyostelium purpureum]|eukprot:XP_003290716.1 hypothetical protein DICPUDRAFT_56890 [Dictyostelium purpureum]
MSTTVSNKKCSFPICQKDVYHHHVKDSHDILIEPPHERSLKAWYCVDCFSVWRSNVTVCEYCNHQKSEVCGWARRRTYSADYLPLC